MRTILTLIAAVLLPNLLNFAFMGIDKRQAKQSAIRIPESVFFCLAVIGGAVGGLLGMRTFHHKTKKWKFRIGLPLILAVQIACLIVLWRSPLQFRFL